MEKNKLLTFIEKYNLNGSIESVKIVADGKTLKTNFVAEDKTLAGNVELKSCDIAAAELAIFETARLKNFLKILNDNITITHTMQDTRLVGLKLADDETEVNFVLSDSSVIPKAPGVKAPKDFDVEIPIDADFVNRFVKAKNSLPDVNSFTLMMNKKGTELELVVGYSSINSNRVKLKVSAVAGKDKVNAPISFNANYFKEILLKNSDSTGAVLKIAEVGISSITFDNDDFTANYFLIKKEIEG
jgi:hypothetical protein